MLLSVAALTAFAALAQANWCPQVGHCWVEPKTCMMKPCDKLCGNPAGDLFVVEHEAAYCDVHEVCQRNGGVLADITNVNFNDATHTAFQCTGANKETWIQSWQHVTYAPNCLVLTTGSQPQGGAINVPESCGKRRFTMCSRSQPKREWHHKDHHCGHCKVVVKECEVAKKCDPCHKHHKKPHHHRKHHHKDHHHKKHHHHHHHEMKPIHGLRPHGMVAVENNDYGVGQGVRPDMARGMDHHRPHGHHDHHKKDERKHCEKKYCPSCQPDKRGRCDHCPLQHRRECMKCQCKCERESSSSSSDSSSSDCSSSSSTSSCDCHRKPHHESCSSSSTSSCSESSTSSCSESSTSSCSSSSSTSEHKCHPKKDHHKEHHHKGHRGGHRMEPLRHVSRAGRHGN